jgi:hypothetical protein
MARTRRSAPRRTAPVPQGPPVARNQAIAGLALGVLASVGAVVWQVAIPLGLLAVALSWLAASAARGRDARSIGFAVGGLTTGAVGIVLAVTSALVAADDEPASTQVVDGIESATPDQANPPQKDLEPGTRCTVDLDGLRAEGAVVNRTTKPWRYSITAVWENEGEQLASSTMLLDTVPAGDRATFRATSPRSGTAATTCRIVSIDRLTP